MRKAVGGSARMLAAIWRYDRLKTVTALLLMVGGAVSAPLLAQALRRTTDAVTAHDAGAAAVAGACVAGLALVALTFGHFAHLAYFELAELAELEFDRRLIAVSNGTRGIEQHEDADQADALTVLQQEGRRIRVGLEALLNLLSLGLAILLTAVLLAGVDPLLLLLPLAALPPLLTGQRAEALLDRSRDAAAESQRLALNLFRVSTSAAAGGELRTFRLRESVLGRHERHWAAASRVLGRAQAGATVLRTAGQLVFALCYIGAVLLVVRETARGHRGVGDLVLVIALAGQVNAQVTAAVALTQNLQRTTASYRRLEDLEDRVGEPAGTEPAGPGPTGTEPTSGPQPTGTELPARLRRGITLENLSFGYPGADRPALDGVDLTLPAGSTVAIVGENGSGKSTLVKLLCGFYRPSGGRILVDGTDLAAIPAARWRERLSAAFQDFVRYEFTVQEAVGVGDLRRLDDAAAAGTALAAAGAGPLLRRLPAGLASALGKSYRDGAELSGGQWQRIALARSLMRPAPLLLVLDEPASALDPEAEHALFRQQLEQARTAAEACGGITVFVSHRFSTVRNADLIVVLRDGVLLEAGDHRALVGAGGLYQELYEIQSRAYLDGDGKTGVAGAPAWGA
ncbi:ABC transporter ATP-binding protein [Kitasatospora phosalacinea]|uniref:ABC transporter ATP-binding protein n=1 Tax=Kitasatospora phosalacinea TaxID=2065 RepID=UPI003660C507